MVLQPWACHGVFVSYAKTFRQAATTVALLVNPANPLAAHVSRELAPVARTIGLELHVVHASSEREFEAQRRSAALAIGSADPLFGSRAALLGALALRHAMPAIGQHQMCSVRTAACFETQSPSP